MRQSPYQHKIIAEGEQTRTASPQSGRPATLSASEVADTLGISASEFARKRRTLEDEAGFPKPLPGLRRYSTAAVMGWINSNGSRRPGQQELSSTAPSLILGRLA